MSDNPCVLSQIPLMDLLQLLLMDLLWVLILQELSHMNLIRMEMGISPGLGGRGGNEGTFNIDDADMGSAANAKMSIGSLNNDAYDKVINLENIHHLCNGWIWIQSY